MKNMMEYKCYYACIEDCDEDNCFFGTITGIIDVVTFEGNSTEELKEAFIEAVEDYLNICKRQGKKPHKAY